MEEWGTAFLECVALFVIKIPPRFRTLAGTPRHSSRHPTTSSHHHQMNVLTAAAELIESDAAFALRIQTSEPVLVSIAKAHGRGAMSAVGMQLLRDRHDWSPTEVSAVVLAPYIFGTLGLHEEPPDPWKGKRLTSERGVPLAVSTVG